VFDEEDEEL
jgi:hypothetical protein